MIISTLLAILAIPGWAQTTVELVDGESVLGDCLDAPNCSKQVTSLLGENMIEYGLVMQADPIALSALGGKGDGVVAEVRFDTVTMGHKNELERMALVPPAVPRVGLGYQWGSTTYDSPGPQAAVGMTVLPPVKILNGRLSSASFDTSVAVPVVSHVFWIGVEAGYGAAAISAPLLGTEQQMATMGDVNVGKKNQPKCTDKKGGCVDDFLQHTGTVRFGVSVEPIPALFVYSRVAAVNSSQQLGVGYDKTTWNLDSAQAQSQTGVGFRAGDFYQLSLGTVVSSRPTTLSTDNTRTMAKVVASTSWRFGHRRSWSSDPDYDLVTAL